MGKGSDSPGLAWKSGFVMIPFWVGTGFQTLGWVYLVFKPLGLTSWIAYAVGVVFAAATAIWTKAAYRVTVLERSERGVVYWIGKRKATVGPAPALTEPDPTER